MLALRGGVHATETEYGVALLDEHTGQYWTLNPTAVVVLRTLLDGGTFAQAARALAEGYDVDAGSADRDVRDLVAELESAELVEPANAAKAPPRHREGHPS